VTWAPLRSYEAQVKVFLVLLVLFLAVAIYCNVHLLVVARNAIQDEVGRRLALQADLVRADLEREQMLRGLRAGPQELPYIPPTWLDRMARVRELNAIEILSPAGRVLSSSRPQRVGRDDPFLGASPGAVRGLRAGGSVVTPLDRAAGPYASLAAYRPIQDASHVTVALVRVEEDVPVLAAVDFNLRAVAALQAGGLVVLLVLVILFARWLLQPYRRLLRAAGGAPSRAGAAPPAAGSDGGEELVAAFEGVLAKLRGQESELLRLKQGRADGPGADRLPGEHLIAGMTSAVLVFDRDGRLAALNRPAEALLRLERGAAVGRRYGDLLGSNWRLIDLIERTLRRGESHSREMVPLQGPTGSVTHLGAMVSPIRPAGPAGGTEGIEGALCLLADLTEIRTLQERVGLKENLAALGEMSAGIAHEFRNSLATIQGFARLIARADPGAAGGSGENAEAILREVRGIEKVVGDFLRFARPAAPVLAECDTAALVRGLVAEFRDDLLGQGLRIEVAGAFPVVQADETLLRQALQNLLRNAAEALGATGEGSGLAEARAERRIVVRGETRGAPPVELAIRVEDNGPGIALEDLPHVFTPFFTTRSHGTGLGLALVQKTAVLHDGRVEIASRPGEGTVVEVILPIAAAAAASGGPRGAA
jgi:two-component system, NtrC family, nitrogen regulation sensor histidine kinase GlnL